MFAAKKGAIKYKGYDGGVFSTDVLLQGENFFLVSGGEQKDVFVCVDKQHENLCLTEGQTQAGKIDIPLFCISEITHSVFRNGLLVISIDGGELKLREYNPGYAKLWAHLLYYLLFVKHQAYYLETSKMYSQAKNEQHNRNKFAKVLDAPGTIARSWRKCWIPAVGIITVVLIVVAVICFTKGF